MSTKIPVIYDTDPGIDDAMALYLLARHPSIDLRAVTTVFGNASVATTTHNAELLCHLFGVAPPVARGAAHALSDKVEPSFPVHVHGADALGDVAAKFAVADAPSLLDPRPAYQLICDQINAEPGEITLVAVGPLTNLALALRHDPSIAGKVKQVVVMGGAFGTNAHCGNVSPVAEANIISDPESADIVFTTNWPVVIVGLDVTQEVVMKESYLSRLQGRGGRAGDFIWQSTRLYQQFYSERDDIQGVYAHDASAAAFLIEPQAFGLRKGPVRVVCEGIARGQTIQDFHDMGLDTGNPAQAPWAGKPSQHACISVRQERVLALFDQAFDF